MTVRVREACRCRSASGGDRAGRRVRCGHVDDRWAWTCSTCPNGPGRCSTASARAAALAGCLPQPGGRPQRVAETSPHSSVLHDLVRLYARSLSPGYEPEVLLRLLDHWLHTLHAACAAAKHGNEPCCALPAGARRPVAVRTFADRRDALAWYSAERETMRGAVEATASVGMPDRAWRLVLLQRPLVQSRCRTHAPRRPGTATGLSRPSPHPGPASRSHRHGRPRPSTPYVAPPRRRHPRRGRRPRLPGPGPHRAAPGGPGTCCCARCTYGEALAATGRTREAVRQIGDVIHEARARAHTYEEGETAARAVPPALARNARGRGAAPSARSKAGAER